MKKLFTLGLLAFFLLSSNSDLKAQNTWVWRAYQVAIDLPTDFKVTKNTVNEFEAVRVGMQIYMYIFSENVSLNEMKGATISVANEIGLQAWDVVQDVNTRGYLGKYIAGYLDGDAVLLCGLINPNNLTNFIVAITFNDQDTVAEQDAMNILYSIR